MQTQPRNDGFDEFRIARAKAKRARRRMRNLVLVARSVLR